MVAGRMCSGGQPPVRETTVVVGAPWRINDPEVEGAVYVFERQTEGPWLETARLLGAPNDHDPSRYEYFGWSVALHGHTLAIGATDDYDDNGLRKGALYVFVRDPNGLWREADRLLGDGGNFGDSVAIYGDTIVVGAPEDDPFGFASGSAYVFERDPNGGWLQTAKLLPHDGHSLQFFGKAVAVHGEVVLAGAELDRLDGEFTGAVYVYERRPAKGWSQTARLVASDAANADAFGSAIAVDGTLAVIAARFHDGVALNGGAAYVFARAAGGAWLEVARLQPPDLGDRDEFGRSVALSGNLAVVGAPFHDVVDSDGNTQVDAGAAYVFAVGPDRDENGVMDVCECRAAVGALGEGFVANPDLDLDGEVDLDDLLILLSNFGRDRDNLPAGHSPPSAALHEYGDLDLDQDIDLADLAFMLAAYDRACE